MITSGSEKGAEPPGPKTLPRVLRFFNFAVVRDFLILLAFCALTALMTWPWVLHLHNAVADPGDPYMIAWSLWWNFHQTFTDPLNLFHANVFYPYKYTLAFSENDYGIALLFFPLFAAGARPLTVHSIATFLGFAFCGYGAFRLTRTLTESNRAAWVAGIVFAFIPFRFHLLSHLHYLFAGWIPLLLEALVLFMRQRSWRRASWLGVSFLMNALTCLSWFIMTLIPLGLTAAFCLATQSGLARDKTFWLRAAIALGIAGLALLPFLLPYYRVQHLYNLRWQSFEFGLNSPSLIHWLAAERRNRVWQHFGQYIPGGHRLFPGLLAPLLALMALRFPVGGKPPSRFRQIFAAALYLMVALAIVVALTTLDLSLRIFGLQIIRIGQKAWTHSIVALGIIAIMSIGISVGSFFRHARELGSLAIIRSWYSNYALFIGLIWLLWGFLSSLGDKFVLNRFLHDHLSLFESIRLPTRWAMICYVGLAVLAGAGWLRLERALARSLPALRGLVFAVVVGALVFELRAFPLEYVKGEVEPDALALYLKDTPMKGGLVELPSSEGLNRHRYMLRAADHGRPLVNATASFISPLTAEINSATGEGPIADSFLDMLEQIPVSYLVIHNAQLSPGRVGEYEAFLTKALASGRLRFIKRFDGCDDLYAVTRTEPEAR
jgi:hypothetical protein